MKREELSQAIGLININYISEALEAVQSKSSRRYSFFNRYRAAAGVCAVLLVITFSFGTVFAANETFRQIVIEILYPLYSNDELKEIDNGHQTGSFDEIDTLLSFLDKFNSEKMEYGLLAKEDNGYAYLMLSDLNGGIIAVVECNITDYKLLVTLKKVPYEDTTGLWQVVSYQVVSNEKADSMLVQLPEYVHEKPESNHDESSSVIDVEDSGIVIYNVFEKDKVVTLTEEEVLQIQSIFSAYTPSEDLSELGLTEQVIKSENVSYIFSVNGDVLVDKDGELSYILLTESDIEQLLEIFNRNNVKVIFSSQ